MYILKKKKKSETELTAGVLRKKKDPKTDKRFKKNSSLCIYSEYVLTIITYHKKLERLEVGGPPLLHEVVRVVNLGDSTLSHEETVLKAECCLGILRGFVAWARSKNS